jgi:hypothetical protein
MGTHCTGIFSPRYPLYRRIYPWVPTVQEDLALSTHNTLLKRGEQIWTHAPDGWLTPRQTGRLAVGQNVILTAASLCTEANSEVIQSSPLFLSASQAALPT